jgi:hypothetical protein
MNFRLALGVLPCAFSLACAVRAPQGSPGARPADGFASVIRAALIADSAMLGAGRAERPVTAGDSVTARLLAQAELPVAPRVEGQMLLCPASTLANGAPPPGLRGYYLRVEVVPSTRAPTDSTVRVVLLTHSCRFMYKGEFSRGGIFATTAYWEVHLRDGRWQITRRLGRSMT